MYSEIAITLFVAFALSRVYLRFREQSVSLAGLIGWTVFWAGVLIIVWEPGLSDQLAQFVGISRGTDVAIIASLLVIFYSLFRIYVQFEMQEREMTRLVRAIALKSNE